MRSRRTCSALEGLRLGLFGAGAVGRLLKFTTAEPSLSTEGLVRFNSGWLLYYGSADSVVGVARSRGMG